MNKNMLHFHHELCTHMQCGQCGAIHEEIIPLNGFFLVCKSLEQLIINT